MKKYLLQVFAASILILSITAGVSASVNTVKPGFPFFMAIAILAAVVLYHAVKQSRRMIGNLAELEEVRENLSDSRTLLNEAKIQAEGLKEELLAAKEMLDDRTRELADLQRRLDNSRPLPANSSYGIPKHSSRLNILLAEDNPINRKLAVRLLQRRGWSVNAVAGGREACAAVREGSYDIVLLDIQMPEMDGFETAKELRRIERSQGGRLPVVAITSYSMKGVREKCLESGMDDYISKPFNEEELYTVIETMTAKRNSRLLFAEGSVNLDGLSVAMKEDRDFMKTCVELLIQEYPLWIAEMRKAAKNNDAAGLSRAAHNFKGAIGDFGAQKAHSLVLEIETAGKKGNPGNSIKLIDELEAETGRVCGYLSTLS